jgi:hypothetical protein
VATVLVTRGAGYIGGQATRRHSLDAVAAQMEMEYSPVVAAGGALA